MSSRRVGGKKMGGVEAIRTNMATGMTYNPNTGMYMTPNTGMYMTPISGSVVYNPNTGMYMTPIPGASGYNPNTGMYMTPIKGGKKSGGAKCGGAKCSGCECCMSGGSAYSSIKGVYDAYKPFSPAIHSALQSPMIAQQFPQYADTARTLDADLSLVEQGFHAVGMGKEVPTVVLHGGSVVSVAKQVYKWLQEHKDGVHFVLDTVVPAVAPSQAENSSKLSQAMRMVGLAMPKVKAVKQKRKPSAHSLAVKRVMAEQGLKLGEASKYVKAHGLGK
jgi:hypothetical protein